MTDYKVEEARALELWNRVKDADIAGSTPGISVSEMARYMSTLTDEGRKNIGAPINYLGTVKMPITLESLTEEMKKPFTTMGFSGILKQGDKSIPIQGILNQENLRDRYDANGDGTVSKGEGIKAIEDIKNPGKRPFTTASAISPIDIKNDSGPRLVS